VNSNHGRKEKKRDWRGGEKGEGKDSRKHGEMKEEGEGSNENNNRNYEVLSSKDVRRSEKKKDGERRNKSR